MKRLRWILSILALSATATAEIYDPPRAPSELDLRDPQYYNDIIANQTKLPSLPGETQGDYILRTSQVPPSEVPPIPTDNGMVGREGKLDDASKMALQGERAATASFGRVMGEMIAMTFTAATCVSGCATIQADLAKLNDAIGKYGQVLTAMDYSKQNNDAGKARMLQDESLGSQLSEGADSAGTSAGGTLASAANSKAQQVTVAVQNMGPKAKEALLAQGLDPEEVTERLLSGELDYTDPSSVQSVLGVSFSLPSDVVAQAGSAPASDRVERILNGDSTGVGARSAPRTAAANPSSGRHGKDKSRDLFYKDPKEAALAGIPLQMFPDGQPGQSAQALKRFLAGLKKNRGGKIRKLSAREYYELLSMGVTVPLHRRNIFQEAHRQYRVFGKYRDKGETMARNP